jgi:hypothetical protein
MSVLSLAVMLLDERSTISLRASSARVLVVTPVGGSEQMVKYLLLDHSQRLTGELPVDETATVRAFVWLFAVKSILNNINVLATDPKVHWRWYLFPAERVVGPGSDRWQETLPVSILSSASDTTI